MTSNSMQKACTMSSLASRLRRGQQSYLNGACDTLPSVDCDTAPCVSAAAATLRLCGFVLLRGALHPDHVQRLGVAYASLPNGSLATAPLRAGRREQLLPFALPFTEATLLHDATLSAVAQEYLGTDELELDALTVVQAHRGCEAQPRHRDVQAGPAAVLSIHIPLVGLGRGGSGALVLQPTSHLRAGTECEAMLPAPIEASPIGPGDALAYDARVCHHGSANVALEGVRPVLYLLLRKRHLGTTAPDPNGARRRATLPPGDEPARPPPPPAVALPFSTGYEPHELLFRFGRAGLETVARFREAWRATRAATTAMAGAAAAAAVESTQSHSSARRVDEL